MKELFPLKEYQFTLIYKYLETSCFVLKLSRTLFPKLCWKHEAYFFFFTCLHSLSKGANSSLLE